MLTVNEIFFSIQGESSQAGRPCIFIRLTGCKLRCTYCDTKYAYHEGGPMEIDDILEKIRAYPAKLVELTGGEPLEQKEAIPLMERLMAEGYEVMLETDGVESVAKVPAGVRIIFDIKTPGSRMQSSKSLKNLADLPPGNEIKFVCVDENDYEFARNIIEQEKLTERYTVLLSPVVGERPIDWLPPLILRDGLPVRFQPQIHKWVWGDKRGV